MTPAGQFASMALVRTRIEEDGDGNVIRIETRKCARTGLVLTRTSGIMASEQYLAAR